MTILYLHGYSGSGVEKAERLQKAFKDIEVIAPKLNELPSKNLENIFKIYKNLNGRVISIGTSMGGYYSMLLSSYVENDGIQINPVVDIQDVKNIVNEAFYRDLAEVDAKFRKYCDDNRWYGERLNFFIAKDDNVLDYKKSYNLNVYKKFLFEEGGHRFDTKFGEVIKYAGFLIKNPTPEFEPLKVKGITY